MPTVAAYNSIVTTDVEQVFDVRGCRDMEISIATAGVILRFASMVGGMPTGLGLPEAHAPKLLNLSDEPMGYVSVKSSAIGVPATVTIIATS